MTAAEMGFHRDPFVVCCAHESLGTCSHDYPRRRNGFRPLRRPRAGLGNVSAGERSAGTAGWRVGGFERSAVAHAIS